MMRKINRKIGKTQVSVINKKEEGGENIESLILYRNEMKYILD
jgi:hypothetical protein